MLPLTFIVCVFSPLEESADDGALLYTGDRTQWHTRTGRAEQSGCRKREREHSLAFVCNIEHTAHTHTHTHTHWVKRGGRRMRKRVKVTRVNQSNAAAVEKDLNCSGFYLPNSRVWRRNKSSSSFISKSELIQLHINSYSVCHLSVMCEWVDWEREREKREERVQ